MYLFISSTRADLVPERATVMEALEKAEALPWGMEFFVSTPDRPLNLCLNEVDRCDAVILLIGSKAGSLVPNGAGLTYTEAEIEHAQSRGLPIFVFIKTLGGIAPNDHPPGDPLRDKLNAFRHAASKIGTPSYFESLADLALNALASLTRWEKEAEKACDRYS